MNPDYIIYAVIAVGIFTAYMALVHIFKPDRGKDRLDARVGITHEADEESAPFFAKFCEAILALFGSKPAADKELAMSLMQAGIASPYAPVYYVFAQRLLQPIALVCAVIVLLMLLAKPEHTFMSTLLYGLVAIMFIVAGVSGASLFLTNAKQRRQKIMTRSFPEAMDLLLVCIESGLGMDAALARVSREMRGVHPEIAYEMDRTRLELTMLSDRSKALENLAERTQIVPFKALVSALIQTEKFGTSLVDTLRVLSDDQRTTRLLTAEMRAARIPVFITIPLIFCILPAFIIIILGPPIVKVIDQGGIFGHDAAKSK